MKTGTVKFFDDVKGWGILVDDAPGDLFVHHKVIKMDGFRSLRRGQTVLFDEAMTTKGRAATVVIPQEGK